MRHAPQPILVEHDRSPLMFPLTTLMLTFIFGMVAGGLLFGVAMLQLRDEAAAVSEGGRP